VARVLKVGTYGAVALIGLGVVLMLANGRSPLDVAPALDLGRMAADIVSLQPAGFVWLGVLLIVATPCVRVLTALIGYLRNGEREMAVVAVLILAVITLGVLASTFSTQSRG
jgi:uncharacterized membrane protein